MVPVKTLRTLPSLYELFNFQKFAELTLLQIQKGSSTTRSDDTKSLKGAILDWITPHGQYLNPPLA
jgi:hypothetical protein